jgi:hypothetical protein
MNQEQSHCRLIDPNVWTNIILRYKINKECVIFLFFSDNSKEELKLWQAQYKRLKGSILSLVEKKNSKVKGSGLIHERKRRGSYAKDA